MSGGHKVSMLRRQRILKRTFDVLFSLTALCLTFPLILLAIAMASLDTRKFGVFAQHRVGRRGRLFRLYKVRTMRNSPMHTTNVTTVMDSRITRVGKILRKTKLDELPQFINVLVGDMSIVGPRPDVPGYADILHGDDRIILSVRPGITGPASIYFRNEEPILGAQNDPQRFNDEVLWPAKVAINVRYLKTYSFMEDVRIIADTALPSLCWCFASRQRLAAEQSKTGIFAGPVR